MKEKIERIFQKKFNKHATCFRAPGRINLIGEHTDYNEGFVLPAAVKQSIYFAIAPNGTSKINIYSADFDETFTFDTSDLDNRHAGSWRSYVFGVVAEMIKDGYQVPGFDLAFYGDIPQGAGMSSSAALECGICYAINELFRLGIEPVTIAGIGQRAEHHHVGVKCGIMDQFASVLGKAGHAILLDCRSLAYQYFPLETEGYRFLLLNSNVSHNLVNSEYNVRRDQCEQGVSVLQKAFPEVKSLRDATWEMLSEVKSSLENVVFRRCKYIIDENERVLDFAAAMNKGKLETAGTILAYAQEAMAREYEITCPEIDFLAEFANRSSVVAGSRMMGGGFGGCTLNLIKTGTEAGFIEEVSLAYKSRFDLQITPIQIEIGDGVSKLSK